MDHNKSFNLHVYIPLNGAILACKNYSLPLHKIQYSPMVKLKEEEKKEGHDGKFIHLYVYPTLDTKRFIIGGNFGQLFRDRSIVNFTI